MKSHNRGHVCEHFQFCAPAQGAAGAALRGGAAERRRQDYLRDGGRRLCGGAE